MTKTGFARNALHIITFIGLFLFQNCQSTGQSDHSKMENSEQHKYTNDLIHESSPYLLQHAHNPVNWRAWNEETLALAKKEDKPILISIGYSACHWCHVMEHESFEDEEVAKIMNEHFICVKVDREERPDVDQVYMSAVQLITGSGGWPLNCFALPDGRPFHGGTYFRKSHWIQVLKAVNTEFTTNREKLEAYSARLTKGVVQGNIMPQNPNQKNDYKGILSTTVNKWKESMDFDWGGPNREPKFPIPNNYQFLLKYAFMTDDQPLKDYVELTLDKMAAGGIYDQIGGGFARYSTDKYWKVPHFEKMLYDNAQLLSLYADGYRAFGKERYKEVILETVYFIERELTADGGAFYSALDADSEGEEGKFYVWSEAELKELFGADADYKFLESLYHLNRFGEWEGNYVLMYNKNDEQIKKEFKLSDEQLKSKREFVQNKLLQIRAKRIRPGLDDKSLTSWNAMMVSGLIDAYKVTGYNRALHLAQENLNFLLEKQLREENALWHSYKEGKSSIEGFLEDYAFLIQATLDAYELEGESEFLVKASDLCEKVIADFYDEKQHMFRFNPTKSEELIVNTIEYQDNVIPSSNSVMAKNLHRLYILTANTLYRDISEEMLKHISPLVSRYGSSFSNWSDLMMHSDYKHYEVVVVGEEAHEVIEELSGEYLPHCMIASTEEKSNDAIFDARFKRGKTLIYVCENNVCQRPVPDSKVKEVIGQIGLGKN